MKVVKVPLMSWREKIAFIPLFIIGSYLSILFAVWWFWPGMVPHNFGGVWHTFDYLLFGLLSYVVWHQITMEIFSWITASEITRPLKLPPENGLEVAFLTAFVPGSEPLELLENTLKSMTSVDYKHDTWVLDEGNNQDVKDLCTRMGVKHFSRHGITEYNQPSGRYKTKTKGGNYNAWFEEYGINYHLVAQIDVDFIPAKNFLTETLGYFRDPDVAFVGTPQIYGNQSESWIARGAAEQAFSFYGHMQKGLCGRDMSLFIGANHIVRSVAHDHINGYSGHIVEDHLTGMNIYAKKWKSVYVPQVLAVGEGPATWESYFSQQMRWSYGLIHILFTESFKLFRSMTRRHIFNYYALQQHYFYGLSQFIGVILLTLYFVFGIQSTLLPIGALLGLYIPLLLFQFLMGIWLQRYVIDRNSETGLLWKGRLLSLAAWPIYALAFFSVVTGKRLVYKVTPKGSANEVVTTSLSLFIPHILLGSITLIDVVIGFMLGHTAPVLVYFAVANTVCMFLFVFLVLGENMRAQIRRFVSIYPATLSLKRF